MPAVSRLAAFIQFLRLRGLPVGTAAALDCGRALREVSILDRDTVRTVCLITLAKSPEEVARLTDAFDLYWSSYIDPAESETGLAVSVPPSPPADGRVTAAGGGAAIPISVDSASVVRFGRYSPDAPSAGHVVSLLDRSRVLAIRSGVRRLRRYAATRPGRHRGPARGGEIDFPKTARHSLRQGGEWVEFRFRKRKKRRADFVVLWDVSGSMREHEANVFALVYAFHRLVRKTRSFAFGTRLEEVTESLRGRSYAHAARAVSGRLHPMGGGTRIGPCLEDFLHRYGGLIHEETTLVIVSDGWDLGETARLSSALRHLRRLSHLVVWVNPYADDPRFEPSTAGMREALPHLDLLLGPGDFEDGTGFAPERVARRRPRIRPATWRKTFITSA
jgi:uncharacterized protein with von Willebrand factor type A (vWA) domain